MADQFIVPKAPEASATPTFTPTPPAPAQPAATPTAPAVPTPAQPPAPGPLGLGTVAAKLTNSVANAKDAIHQMAQPAPLPPEAQPAPATPVAPTPPPGTTPTGTVPKPTVPGQGGAPAATPAKPAPAKTVASASLDALAPVTDTIKKMMEGDDPIAAIQYNQILNGTGPRNQAMLQGMGMKLKQANLDGQGAGTAMLEMMARDNEYEVGQLTSKVAADSATRLLDMNKWGFEQAQQISQAADKQKRDDLNTFIHSGQFDAAKGAFEQLYPGVPFDATAMKAADPTRAANYTARMKVVDQFVSQGNADQAKAAFMQLAKDMPEMFGFSDAATAQAALSNVDFTSEAWQNNLNATNAATTAARTAALQGDPAGVSAAIDQKFAKMTPAAVEAIGNSTLKRPLDEINAILKDAGMAPVATSDEAAMIDKVKLAKAASAYDVKKDATKEAPDRLFDIFAKANPAMAIDPQAAQYAKAYLSSAAYQLATSPDGSVSLGSFDAKGQVPPWDPSSPQAPLFMDWPHATFNPDGTVAEHIYDGLKPYDANYKPGDLTNAKGAEDARLDKAYKDFSFSTPADKHMSMEQWYYASAGGTKPVDATKVPGSITTPVVAKTPAIDPNNPDDIKKVITDFRSTGKLTPDQTAALKASGSLQTVAVNDIANLNATDIANNSVGGLIQTSGGDIVKVLPESGNYAHHTYVSGINSQNRMYNWAKVEVNGKQYKIDNQGNWYPGDAALRTTTGNGESLPATVPNPLSK